MPDFELERYHFPILEQYAYMDNCTCGAMPQYACDAICAYTQKRMRHAFDMEASLADWSFAARVREEIAALLNAPSGDNIALGMSQSELYNNVFINNIELGAGDNVITYDTAFPTMTYVWFNKQKLGIELRLARSVNGAVPVQALFDLADERTRVISICSVDNSTGYRHDLKAIGEFCRARGILFAVDATQSCGALFHDVREIKADFFTSSTYKWLQSPHGLGFAYIDGALLPKLKQTAIGWTGSRDFSKMNNMVVDLSDTARRFDTGGLNFTAMHGLSSVIANYQRLGGRAIEARILSTVDYLYKSLESLKEVKVFGHYPPEHRSSVVLLEVPAAWNVSDASLAAHGVRAHIFGGTRLRLGIHYFNNQADIDRLLGYLQKCAGK